MSAAFAEMCGSPRNPFRVFGLGLDGTAAERARWLAGQMSRRDAGRREVLAQIWKLDSVLAAGALRELLAQDAAESDVLVIAISSLDLREPALIDWLNSLPSKKPVSRRGRLLVGLFGDEGHPAGELAWLVAELGGFARQTDRRFLWQWMAEGALQDTDWLEAGIAELAVPASPPPLLASAEAQPESPRPTLP